MDAAIRYNQLSDILVASGDSQHLPETGVILDGKKTQHMINSNNIHRCTLNLGQILKG